jgi:hypothetical protein
MLHSYKNFNVQETLPVIDFKRSPFDSIEHLFAITMPCIVICLHLRVVHKKKQRPVFLFATLVNK